MNVFRLLQAVTVMLASTAMLAACAPKGPQGPVVFAASSLQTPLDALAEKWVAKGHEAPVFSYASSTALARHIENGSMADLYISADAQWTKYIVSAGKIDPAEVKTLASNRIVLATHHDGPHAKKYEVMPTTQQILTGVTVGSGDPDSVPLGRYTKEILVAEGIWDDIGPRLIRTSSSSAALRLVLLKEAEFGFLYASDVERRDELFAYRTFAQGLHAPIRYKAIRLPSSGHPDAAAFLDYLVSDEAAEIFAMYDFDAP